MTDRSTPVVYLPKEQQALRARCFHPSGSFVEFKKEDVETSIPERFERIVRLYPSNLAVKMGNRSLTYDQLNKTANRIAHVILEKRGVGSEPVVLLFEHGVDVIAAILGVLKAGKFYVVLSPSFPPARNGYVLKNSGAGLIVTNEGNLAPAQNLAADTCGLINIDENYDWLLSDNPGVFVSPKDPAAIVYTSGSTGEPKGLLDTHRNCLDRLVGDASEVHTCVDDKLSLVHSLSFRSAEGDLLISLLNGATLFPLDIKTAGIHGLVRLVEEERITICHLPPAAFRQLADSLEKGQMLPSLRVIFLSGAPIGQTDFDLYKKHFSPGVLLKISMGSTETRWISSALVDRAFCFPERGSPIGFPYRGRQILLLDENGEEVKPGEVGEIAVKGRDFSLGYWKNPELTRAKFLSDPGDNEGRIYLTGDIGQMLSDGFLVHLGRKDFLVKIRGFRVEIGEIEKALLSHSQVKGAAVMPWDRDSGETYLAAYIVPREPTALTVTELKDYLEKNLPDYMIPSTTVFMLSLPLTNGKLDRKALPKPNGKRPELNQTYLAPRNDIEKTLVKSWEEILDIRPIGVYDNFFDLGGHSLAAARVVSRVIKTFQLELSINMFFDSPTVAKMAGVIAEHPGQTLGDTELKDILDDLESLSDDEAQRLLGDQNKQG